MLFTEIHLNNKLLAIGGGKNLQLLTLSLVGDGYGHLWLSLTGAEKDGSSQTKHLTWISQYIDENDIVRCKVIDSQLTNPTPIIKQSAILSRTEKSSGPEYPEENQDEYLGQKPLSFDVSLSDGRSYKADIEENHTLQFVLTSHVNKNESEFSLDSITVNDQGYTKGKHWDAGTMRCDDWIELKIRVVPSNRFNITICRINK